MMRIASVDTATWWGGVALLERDARAEATRVVAETGLLVRDSHAAHVLGLLESLLERAGWGRTSLDAFAATRGPGSFTGIRVGMGTIRGLGIASGRPCVGIGTLEAMAEAFGPADRDRVPLLDAGRGEVYGARYDAASAPPVEREAPWVGPAELAGARSVPTVLFGPGAARYATRIRAANPEARLMREALSVAAAAGRLAWLRLAAGATDGDGFSPLYVRPPDAEIGRSSS